MAEKAERGTQNTRRRLAIWAAVTGAVLLVPLIAMRFTGEVDWTVSDFVFAAVLIFGVGVAWELAVRTTPDWAYRAGVGVALAAAFLLIWINAAVGIIGDEGNVWNLMFAGVLLVALLGAAVARFRPQGMARAMYAAAGVQVLVGAVAIIGGLGLPVTGPLEMAGLTGLFAALWLVSARLFAVRRS